MSEPYALFLDDTRQPEDVKWIDLPPLPWVVVKTYQEFIDTIRERGIPTTVSFDHDLADEHYNEFTIAHDERMLSKGRIRYDRFKEKTGYECAKFLANCCIDSGTPIPPYYIHTLNPIGQINIFHILESARHAMEIEEEKNEGKS